MSKKARKVEPEAEPEPKLGPFPTPKEPEPLSSTVKVKVAVGTLMCEEGIFQKGAIFETSRERALHFGADVEIV